jgi:hypothetical protein
MVSEFVVEYRLSHRYRRVKNDIVEYANHLIKLIILLIFIENLCVKDVFL